MASEVSRRPRGVEQTRPRRTLEDRGKASSHLPVCVERVIHENLQRPELIRRELSVLDGWRVGVGPWRPGGRDRTVRKKQDRSAVSSILVSRPSPRLARRSGDLEQPLSPPVHTIQMYRLT
jgi:hypothetical protein